MRQSSKITILAGAVALVVAGCGSGGPEIPDPFGLNEPVESTAPPPDSNDPPPVDPVEHETATDEALTPLPISPQEIGTTVFIGGIEYTIDSLDVLDLDAERELTTRNFGAQVTLSGSATNPNRDTVAPSATVAIQWVDDETGHSFEANSMFRGDGVPGGGTGPLEIDITLHPDQLETFNQDTATVIVGNTSRSPALVPLGTQGELVTRIPVQQDELIDQVFDVGGELIVTILAADLRWDANQGSETGQGILELAVEVHNDSDNQQCWSRGTGNTFSLLNASGVSTADLGMSDRGCVASGESTVSWTGVPVHEEYAGAYTLMLNYPLIGSDLGQERQQVSLEITLVEEPAVLLSQR